MFLPAIPLLQGAKLNLGSENEHVEFKRSTSELKEGIASIAAILNKHGRGELYFGVKNNGDVCGMQVSDTTLREIGQAIDQSIEPRIHPEILECDDGEGHVYISIAFCGDEAPYASKGVYRMRVSDSDVIMSAAEVRRMSAKSYYRDHPWDEQTSDTSLDEIDEDALKDYLRRGTECGRITFGYAGVEDALSRLELLHDGKLTNAGKVLFSRPKYVMLKMAIFATDARVNILDMHQERENLFKMARMAEDYIMQNIKWRFVIDGAIEREEAPEIPRAAIREAVINAFCHRDYTSELAVQVDIFGDKIEIFSPGWFPPGVTPEQLLRDDAMPYSKSPNKLIAQTLYRSRDIESYGTGLHRIKGLCAGAGIAFEYATGMQGTIIRFMRPNWFENSQDANPAVLPADSSRFQQIPADSSKKGGDIADLPKNELVVYEFLRENPCSGASAISGETGIQRRTLSNILKRLQERNLVKATGNNRAITYSVQDQ